MAGFYEDDEPVEDIVAAFEGGQKVATAAPLGRTAYFTAPGSPPIWSTSGT